MRSRHASTRLPPLGPRRPKPRRRLAWRLLAGVPSLMVLAMALWVGVFALYAPALPDTKALMAAREAPVVTLLAADGTLLLERSEAGARFVGLDAVSPRLIEAVIATEDARFWRHFGLDPLGILRAMIVNLSAGEVTQGGSTITQQLAKLLFLTPERSIRRKLEEVTLALWLEARLAKQEILTLYVNKVYLGAGTYGVEAASRRYFAKPAGALSTAEAAMVAGLLKAPSALAPTNDLARSRARAAVVLERMVDAGYLSREQAEIARARPAKLAADARSDVAAHATDWILDGLEAAMGRPTRDLTVKTTIDPRLQRVAERALAELLAAEGGAKDVSEGAIVLLDTSGAVRAMVGGANWRMSQLNRAVTALRQPGSAFKPFAYATALERGWRTDALLEDRPIRIGGWSPQNFDDRFRGDVTLEAAFTESLNAPTARLVQAIGASAVAQTAYRLGIASPLQAVPSIALGTSEVTLLELTGAYLPFATGGLRRPVFAVLEVQGGKRSLYRHRAAGERVLDARIARDMARLLRQAVDTGTGKAARIQGRVIAGKTGTTQNSRDAWFVGFAGAYVLGVWLGNDDGTPMKNVTGGTLPARLWRSVMLETPPPPPEPPAIAERPPEPDPPNLPERVARDAAGWLGRLVEDALATARR